MLDQPVWMLVMLLGLAAALVGWRVLRSVPPARRVVVVGARCVSFACLALALAGMQRVKETDRLTVIGVVDVSGSVRGYADLGVDDLGQPIGIGAVAMDALMRGSFDHRDEDRLGVIAFDGGASVVSFPRPVGSGMDVVFDLPETDGTDIGGAIRRAQSLIAGDSRGRIVLFSDGVSTAAGLERLVPTAPVDVVPIEYNARNETLVRSVEIPARVTPDSLMPVRVTMRSTGVSDGVLRIVVDGKTVNLTPETPDGGLPLRLSGGVEPITLSVPVGSGRVHRVRAVWEPARGADDALIGDTNTLNNEATALTLTSEHGRAMVVSSNPQSETTALIASLKNAGWAIDPYRPSEVPTTVLELEAYDLVVLVNTPRDALMPGIEAALDGYVRSLGGGLVFIGGYEALGAGGWNAPVSGEMDEEHRLIADLLPLDLEVPDDVVTTHAAVMLVLDSSGSMSRPVMGSSRSQQEVANSSAAGAIEVLDPTDMVGVVSFSSSPRLVVPIAKNDEPEGTQTRINSIVSGGGTNLAPAMAMARDQLLGIDAKTKHIVVLSDGESEDSDRLPAMAQAMAAQGIKVSTITIGDEADEQTMRLIAENSGGVYYRVVNPSVLPRIFLKAMRVLRRPMVREGVIRPVVVDGTSPMLIDSVPVDLPRLGGLVLTEFKSDDPRVMVPIVSDQGEPILAGHQVELGRVAVFTSDASQWGGEWTGSASFDRFFARLAQWTGRAEDPGAGELSVDQSGGGLTIGYSAFDESGVPIDGLSVTTKVFASDTTSQSVELVQVGPGQYRAELSSVASGDHVIVATPTLGGKPIRPTIGAVHLDDHREFDTLRSDRAALESLAARSGGRVLSLGGLADLFSRDGLARVSSYEPLWMTLVVMGFVLFLVDLGARRVAWDRWIAQARDETIAVSRSVSSVPIGELGKRSVRTQPEVRIDLEPVRRQRPTPKRAADDAEIEEITGLMAAKKRARERMDES